VAVSRIWWAFWFAVFCYLALGIFGCGTVTEPSLVQLRQVPIGWRAAYDSVARCAGLRGDYSRLTFYEVPDGWQTADGTWVYGRWTSDHAITVATVPGEPGLLRHEMLHDLLYDNGLQPVTGDYDHLHPSPPFGVCAPVRD
jgi:hypothetical protein